MLRFRHSNLFEPIVSRTFNNETRGGGQYFFCVRHQWVVACKAVDLSAHPPKAIPVLPRDSNIGVLTAHPVSEGNYGHYETVGVGSFVRTRIRAALECSTR